MLRQIGLFSSLGIVTLVIFGQAHELSKKIKMTSAQTDLEFMYNQVIENHPGMFNREDSCFTNNLKKSFTQSKKFLAQAVNDTDEKNILNLFIKSFNDSHLGINWHKKAISTIKKPGTFEIKKIAPEVFWITIPTFDITSNQEDKFKALVNELPLLRTKKAIIFDLRGNQGGNSDYANQIINSLFSENYAQMQQNKANKQTFVDWRASNENLIYIKELSANKAICTSKAFADFLKKIVNGMEESIRAKKPYYREYFSTSSKQEKLKHAHNVSAKIICIIHHSNISAALDFLDELKSMNYPVIFIGQTTKADRVYMEIRSVELPSKQGYFFFPIKVYRNRLRGDNVPYYPDIFYNDNINDTRKLMEFVLKTITDKKSN